MAFNTSGDKPSSENNLGVMQNFHQPHNITQSVKRRRLNAKFAQRRVHPDTATNFGRAKLPLCHFLCEWARWRVERSPTAFAEISAARQRRPTAVAESRCARLCANRDFDL